MTNEHEHEGDSASCGHERRGGHGHHGHGRHGGGHGRPSSRRHGDEFGRGYWRGQGLGRPNRTEWLARLEEYQKDLEQRVADVADLIRRLKDECAPAQTASV